MNKKINLKNLTMPKIVKGGPFRLFENQFCCKISETLKGDPLETIKIFEKKIKNENFEKFHNAENCKRGTVL